MTLRVQRGGSNARTIRSLIRFSRRRVHRVVALQIEKEPPAKAEDSLVTTPQEIVPPVVSTKINTIIPFRCEVQWGMLVETGGTEPVTEPYHTPNKN